jgi:hypothetical protein
MNYDRFIRVPLAEDLPERRLRRGNVATVVEQHAGRPGQKPGCTFEVFDAVGESVDVVTVRESQIEPLTADELLTVRPIRADSHRLLREPIHLAARVFCWRRMISASARSESFTACALGNTLATSGSRTPTFVPCA